ncbi:MAG: hypothetical protein LBV27_04340 [Oscillospiraceae bacterium]|nr:hypothetical protein [Oscillospiraceae bacterium]
MLSGISTACFYPQHTEDALETVCQMGVQCTEIFANCAEELTPAYTSELQKMADFHGVKILSLHPYTSAMEGLFFFPIMSADSTKDVNFIKNITRPAIN